MCSSGARRNAWCSIRPVQYLLCDKSANVRPQKSLATRRFLYRSISPIARRKRLQYAIGFANELGAEIILLHATYLGYIYSSEGTALYDVPGLQKAARENAERQMRKLVRAAKFGGVKFETVFTDGSPVLDICDFAKDHDVDLIITSTHGLTGFEHVLIGSIAEKVVRHAPCSVLVVPSHPQIRSANLAKTGGRKRRALGSQQQPRKSPRGKAFTKKDRKLAAHAFPERRKTNKFRESHSRLMKAALSAAKSQRISTQHVVELRKVSLRFGDKQVLDDVSLTVAPQERLVIIGQSGAGKTTILRLILGILKPNEGSVFFKQHEVSRMNDHELEAVRMRMGMVYQDAALLSSLTVRENLALPLQELTNKTPAEIDKVVDEKLEMVDLTGEDNLMPFELSGGMRKRVGLARALMMEPELILFDEPTQGLDPVIGALIDELIIDLTKRTKTTSIIVTHLMDSAFHVATRMAMLHRGKIIEQGTPEHMRQSKNPVVVQFLSGTTEGPILERSKYHMLSPAD